MSDSPENPAPPTPDVAPEPSPRPPRRRRWRRRLLITLGVIVVLVVLLRVFLHLLLPPVISQVARQFGFEISYRRLDLVMLGGDFAIWDVVLKPLDGRDELIRTEYAFVNVDTFETLRRLRIHVLRLEADRVKVDLVRKADGTIPLLDQLLRGAAVSKPDAMTPPSPSTSPADALPDVIPAPKDPAPIAPGGKPLDFTIPVVVDAIRLNRVSVDVLDESVRPHFKQTVNVNLGVSRLGAAGTPAELDLSVWTTSLLDRLNVSGSFKVHGADATGSLALDIRGLRPQDAEGYLSLAGLRADGRAMDIHGVAEIELKANATRPGTVSGTASLSNLSITAGSSSAASLRLVALDIAELSPSSLWLRKVDIRDGAIEARRDEDGSLGFAAIQTGTVTPSDSAAAPSVSATPPAVAASPAPRAAGARAASSSALVVRIDEVTGAGLVAAFTDAAVAPRTTLSSELTELRLANLLSSGPPDTQTTVRARLRLPGITDDVRIDGTLQPFAAEPTGRLAISASAIRPERLAPYLAAGHTRSTLQAGEFACSIVASVNVSQPDPVFSLAIKDVRLSDLGKPLLEMPEITVAGLGFGDGIALDNATFRGPTLSVRTLPEGRLQLPGLMYDPALAATPPPTRVVQVAEVDAPAAPSRGLQLPRLRVGRVAWEAGTLRFEDGVTQGVEPLVLSDARFELRDLLFDPGQAAAAVAKPGRITGRMKLDGVIDALTLDGTMTPGDRSLAVAVTVSGERLQLSRLTPYLAPLGVEPTWTDARLDLAADAEVRQLDDGFQLAGNVRDLRLSNDKETLLEATQLGVDRLALRDGGFEIGNVTVDRPLLRAARDKEGRIIVAGIRLVPTQAVKPDVAVVPAPVAPPPAAAAAENSAPAPANDLFTLLQGIGPISVQSLNAVGVTLAWSDQSTSKPVDLRLSLDAGMGALSINRGNAAATSFRVQLAAKRLFRTATIEGQLQFGNASVEASASVLSTGLNLDTIGPYLPDGIAAKLDDGQFKVNIASTLARHPAGGYRASLDVRNLGYSDGERTLAGFERFDVALDRFDPPAGVIAIDRIALAGLQADLARGEDGSIDAMGLRVGGPSAAAAPPAPPRPEATPVAAAAEPAAAADLQTLVAQGQATLPLLSVERLDLGVRRVSFTDRLRPQAAPVAIADLRVRNTAPIRLLGKTPKDNPPVAIAIEGSIDPIVKRFDVASSVSVFADRPTLAVSVNASGIDGAALNRVAPELNGVVDGSPLVDGRFQTKLSAEARVKRSSPSAIDLSRGFDLDFSVEGTSLRLGPGENAVVLAGVDSVAGRNIKIDPGSGNVHARSIEVDGLEANVWLDEKGLNVLGLAIAMPADEPSTRASGVEAAQPVPGDVPPAHPPSADSSPSAEPSSPVAAGDSLSEVRIDSLTISGLQFRLEDRTVSPPTVIPVTALDADIRGLSSLATVADRPIRFDVSMASGKVSLPKPLRGGALVGALADLQARSRGEDSGGREWEDRDFFAQIAARGEMSLYPKPRGRAVAAVNGLELAALRGLAARSGVAISEGTFDGRFDLKSRESGDLEANVRLVLTDLQMADSPDAAVQRYLALPAPLDSVIDLVQAADGSITLPIGFTVRDGSVNVGEIIASGVGALSQVLVTAVASAPVKVVSGVASLFGDIGGATATVEEEPLRLTLDVGVVSLPDPAGGKLAAILSEASRNPNMVVEIQHQLGTRDVEMARVRGNPSPAQVQALAEQLRRDRQRLLADRERALQLSRGELGGMPVAPGQAALPQLQAVQEELAAIERSFDELYDLLRPGADRDAARRTRAAAISLADARLRRVRGMVESLAGPAAAERVRVGVARFNPNDTADSQLVVKVVRRVQVR